MVINGLHRRAAEDRSHTGMSQAATTRTAPRGGHAYSSARGDRDDHPAKNRTEKIVLLLMMVQVVLLFALVGTLVGVLVIANQDDEKISTLISDARSTNVLAAATHASADIEEVHKKVPELLTTAVHIVHRVEALIDAVDDNNATDLIRRLMDVGEELLQEGKGLAAAFSGLRAVAQPP